MGNSESTSKDIDTTMYTRDKNEYYSLRYNLVPSFKNNTYETINKSFFGDDIEELPRYVDLRKDFVDILNIGSFAFNPIACVSYLLQYSLLKNELLVFPPSLVFIYKNCLFYKGH